LDGGFVYLHGNKRKGLFVLLFFCPNHVYYFNLGVDTMELGKSNLRDDGKPPGGLHLFRYRNWFTVVVKIFKKITMEKIRDWKWILFITILASVLSLAGNFIFRGCTEQSDAVNKAASKEDLEKKEISIKGYIDTQDNSVRSDMNDKDDAATLRMDRIQLQVSSKADKDDFDKLWNLAIKNNDILIQIAIKNGIKVESNAN
jgi:hypothetical protein